MNKLTELPKDWYVIITEDNKETIKSWWIKSKGGNKCWSFGAAYGIENGSLNAVTKPSDFGGIEISFEQFKKWVYRGEIELDKDELIAKAKRDYPKGTKIISLKGKDGKSTEETIAFMNNNRPCKFIWYSDETAISHIGLEGYVYFGGEWATIIEESKPQFKVGDKVCIPKTKHGESNQVASSTVIKIAINLNQDFLYIKEIKGDRYSLAEEMNVGADYFDLEDLVPYLEPEQQEIMEDFSIKYNNEEEYNLIVKWCKDRDITMLGDSDYSPQHLSVEIDTIRIRQQNKTYQTYYYDDNLPLKTLSDLGIYPYQNINLHKSTNYPLTPKDCIQPIKHQQSITITKKAKGKKAYILPQFNKLTN